MVQTCRGVGQVLLLICSLTSYQRLCILTSFLRQTRSRLTLAS